jgi:hypothetical protein
MSDYQYRERNRLRQAAFKERWAAAGIIHVAVWIPERHVADLKALTKYLREDLEREFPSLPKPKRKTKPKAE